MSSCAKPTPRCFGGQATSVSADLFDQPDDATPLTPEEREGLIPSHIAYRHELNQTEQENIIRAEQWALARRRDLLSEKFLRGLHKRMLGDVWRWAGKYRTGEKNLGIPFYEVPMAMRQLIEDTKTQIESNANVPDEIAIRFSYRFVKIHPFPNGNGRLSRLMADLLLVRLGGERFTWGRASLQPASDIRNRYIEALKAADNHDFAPLLAFARS